MVDDPGDAIDIPEAVLVCYRAGVEANLRHAQVLNEWDELQARLGRPLREAARTLEELDRRCRRFGLSEEDHVLARGLWHDLNACCVGHADTAMALEPWPAMREQYFRDARTAFDAVRRPRSRA